MSLHRVADVVRGHHVVGSLNVDPRFNSGHDSIRSERVQAGLGSEIDSSSIRAVNIVIGNLVEAAGYVDARGEPAIEQIVPRNIRDFKTINLDVIAFQIEALHDHGSLSLERNQSFGTAGVRDLNSLAIAACFDHNFLGSFQGVRGLLDSLPG